MILLAENGEQQQQVREEIRAFKPLAEIKSVSELQRGLERTEAFFLETMRYGISVIDEEIMIKNDRINTAFEYPSFCIDYILACLCSTEWLRKTRKFADLKW